MIDAGFQVLLGSYKCPDFTAQEGHQFLRGIGSSVRQGILQKGPDPLVGIEFRSVWRERFEMETGEASEELFQQGSLVDLPVIEQGDDMAAQMLQQVTEEQADLFTVDVCLVEMTVQADTPTKGAERDGGNGGDSIMPVAVVEDRCLAAGAPCLAHRRDQQESRFVDEDDVGCQP